MISKTAEYALRAIVTIARHEGAACTAQKISATTQISSPYLRKLMQTLVHANLVRSKPGALGGFVLSTDPSELTVWEVVNAIEPFQRIRECPLGIAAHEAFCPLHQRLDEAMAMFEESMREITVAELLDLDGGGTVTSLCEAEKGENGD